jgi:hypothetical protein
MSGTDTLAVPRSCLQGLVPLTTTDGIGARTIPSVAYSTKASTIAASIRSRAAGTVPGSPVAVTQPITFSLLRKSRHAGDFVTVRGLRALPPNTSALNGENRPFLPTEPSRRSATPGKPTRQRSRSTRATSSRDRTPSLERRPLNRPAQLARQPTRCGRCPGSLQTPRRPCGRGRGAPT